jgi:hypothetical protein
MYKSTKMYSGRKIVTGTARSRTKIAGKSAPDATTAEKMSTLEVMNFSSRSLRCRPQSVQILSNHFVNRARFSGVWTTVAKRRVAAYKDY